MRGGRVVDNGGGSSPGDDGDNRGVVRGSKGAWRRRGVGCTVSIDPRFMRKRMTYADRVPLRATSAVFEFTPDLISHHRIWQHL